MAMTKIFKQEEELIVSPSVVEPSAENMSWYSGEYEGQLSVDVYQTADSLVIRSTIAGVKQDDLEITLNEDVVTIRGKRYQEDEVLKEDYFYQECYWGGFSRSIVLPVEVKAAEAKASLKNGVLTIVLPKSHRSSAAVSLTVESEDE
jgi:HSP20 family protein